MSEGVRVTAFALLVCALVLVMTGVPAYYAWGPPSRRTEPTTLATTTTTRPSVEQRLDRLSAELAKLNRPYVGLRDRTNHKCTRTGPVEAVQLLHDPRWRLDDTC